MLFGDGPSLLLYHDNGNELLSFNQTVYSYDWNSSSDSWIGGVGLSNFYRSAYADPKLYIYAPIPVYNYDRISYFVAQNGYIDQVPYFANTNAQLSGLTVGELSIVTYDVPSSLLTLSLNNDTTDELLFTANFHSENYDQYISRVDVDDPFSDLAYNIPFQVLPAFQFIEGNQYTFYLNYSTNVDPVTRTFIVSKTINNIDIPLTNPVEPTPTPTPDPNQGLIDSNKETQNILNDQTNAIKEQTETNKNIFQKIGDILSFINPFSDNFFGRKLVELIIDGIKSLFIPEDDFFSNYFDEIKTWFSDRLGFLWSPFDLLINILERMLSINFSEPKFTIPDINEPFTNNKIISSQEFNFNDLLENSTIKTVHDIYLILVDAFIVFNLYKLAQDKLEEVFTK